MKHTCCQGAHRDAHTISGKKLPRGYDAMSLYTTTPSGEDELFAKVMTWSLSRQVVLCCSNTLVTSRGGPDNTSAD